MQFDVYILSGKGKGTDETIQMLYIASCKMAHYFISRVYDDTPSSIFIKKAYLWQLKRIIKEHTAGIDLVMVDMHKIASYFLKMKNAFLLPGWVRMKMDITKPKEEIIDHLMFKSKWEDLKRTLKKITKLNYSYEIFNDPESLKIFYEKMHVPYIQKRYPKQADFKDLDYYKKILKKGELIFVKRDDQYVAAVICYLKNNSYFWHSIGILDGNEDFVKDGALYALYYFSILRAKDKKAKMFDFGVARPFLSDGVLSHKKKWGAGLFLDRKIERVVYLKIHNAKRPAKVFAEQPFICIEKDKFKAVAFLNHGGSLDHFDIQAFIKKYSVPGITSFIVNNPEVEKEYPILPQEK
jgi:hypothetical protein